MGSVGAFRPLEAAASVPFQASPPTRDPRPFRRVDSTADPTHFGASHAPIGLVRIDRGRHRLPPTRSDLRREARIPGCVVAIDGDPAQDGVRRQDVVVSTFRFGCRSGESIGPVRIGTFSWSSRKGRRFAGPPHPGVTGLGSRGVSCPYVAIPGLKTPSSVSPKVIVATSAARARTRRRQTSHSA